MKLTFTDNYIPHKDYKETPIEIKSKCVVTNYDPQSKDKYGAGDLLFSVDGGSATVKTGNDIERNAQKVNFNPRKFSVFTAIAALDGDASNLTKKDISLAKKYFNEQGDDWQKLSEAGVTKVKYDSHAGVATILMGDDELLRIDFRTWWERIGWEKDSSKLAMQSITQVEETVAHSEEEEKVEEPKKTEVHNPELMFYQTAINKVLADMNKDQKIEIKITKKQLNNKIKEIAKNVPCSEKLVAYIMNSESFQRKVGKVGNTEKAKSTVGFGHTRNAISNNKFGDNFEISNETAFDWLEQDIKDVIDVIKKKENLLKVDWENVPQSIQEAIIDLTFNVGQSIIENKDIGAILQKAAESGSYAESAVRVSKIISDIPDVRACLMKRCCYRFLLAIKDLPLDQKVDAMKQFESYYESTIKELKKNKKYESEKEMLEGDWFVVKRALGLYEEEEGITTHIVQPGECLSVIAKQYPSVTSNDIIKLNNLPNNGKNIYPGQRLKVPKTEVPKESV